MANMSDKITNLGKVKTMKLKDKVAQWGRKKTLLIGGAGLALVTSLLWFTGIFSSGAAAVQAATSVVSRGDIRVVVSGSGTVSGIMEQNMVAQVGGIITSIGFNKGTEVKKGDVLLTLDSASVRQKLTSSNLSLQQSQFNYSQSVDTLSDLNVAAPFDGLITEMNVTIGDEVNKGDALVTVVNNKEMEVNAQFVEKDASKIAVGQTVDVFLQEFLYTLPGQVSYVSSAAQPDESGAVVSYVKIVVTNPGGLYQGINCSATIHTGSGDVSSTTLSTLQYHNTTAITASADGTVTKLYAQQNDQVAKGQKIMEVKSNTASADVTAKQLSLKEAQITAEIAKDDSKNLTIVAPFDGVLVSTGREVASSSSSSASTTKQELIVGDEVDAGDVVAKVANYDQMLVTISVDEVDIPKIALGQKATITADALPDQKYQGEVVIIGAEGTSTNGVASFDVTIRIDEPDGLKAGMTVNADILVAEKTNALLVPIEALQERQGKKYVILAGDSKQQNNLQEVEIGLNNETYIEVLSGLNEGDKVTVPTAQKSSTTTGENKSGGVMMQGGMGGPPPGR